MMSAAIASTLSWTLSRLFAAAGVAARDGSAVPSVPLISLCDDSRQAVPGSCFVAVRGVGCDGHAFVGRAIEAGAAAVVVERDVPIPGSAVIVRVSDTRMALARLAAAFHGLRGEGRDPLKIVGVTGTNGKTTVTWLLRSIFQSAGHPTALLGTIEYDLIAERATADMTTPGPLELCRRLSVAREAGASHAVMEVSSHALDQRRCDGLSFSAGVFTNLTGDHLDYHGTMEAYAAAKQRLFSELESDAVAVVNADDPASDTMVASSKARVVRYGLKPGANVHARVESMTPRGMRLAVRLGESEFPLRSPLVGLHNAQNLLAAMSTAWALGIDNEAIVGGLGQIDGVPGRLQRVEPEGCPFSVLVDYAHTDDALRNVLQALRPLTERRLICVFGCGGDRDRTKRPRMARVVEALADVAVVTSDNPRSEPPESIIAEILGGFGRGSKCRVVVEVSRRAAIEAAIRMAGPGDAVLIAGKGHENYQLMGGQVLPFDDAAVARECLSSSGDSVGTASRQLATDELQNAASRLHEVQAVG